MPDQRSSYDPDDRNFDDVNWKPDGNWDGLISNPDLREAFNQAVAAGHSNEDAHVIAEVTVFGQEAAADKYGNERVDELLEETEAAPCSDSDTKGEATEDVVNERNERNEKTLSDWGDEKIYE